jgi:hydroxymethylpyrimidine pyrophosphatase-like HAD family hydrolase
MNISKKLIIAWDLDGTLIDSSHRISFKNNGEFDLDYWIQHSIEEFVMKDKLLPLAELYYEYKKTGFTQICVTARELSEADYKYFKKYNLEFDMILHRNNSKELDEILKSRRLQEYLQEEGRIPFLAFDDKQENLEVFDKFSFRTMHAAYLNKKLEKNSYNEVNFKPSSFVGS